MSEESLNFGPGYADAQLVRRLRRHLGNAVDSIGLGVASAACGLKGNSDLKTAIDGEPGRYVRLDWLPALLRMASSDDRGAFLADLLAAFDLEAVPRLRRSTERRLLDLEARVRDELGKKGGEIVDDERNRP